MSSYSIDVLSILKSKVISKTASFIIGVWFSRGFSFKENHLALLKSAIPHLDNNNLELEIRNHLFTQLLNFNIDYVVHFLSTIPNPQIPSIQGANKSGLEFFNQAIQPLPNTTSADSKELRPIPQNKSPLKQRPESKPIIPIPIQYKTIPYSPAQNSQPAPIPQPTRNARADQRKVQVISANYDKEERRPMKYEPIHREDGNIPADAQSGSSSSLPADMPRAISKSAKKRLLKKAKKKFQSLGQGLNPSQLLPNSNPQQLQSSMNPQQLSPSMNPQQLQSSMNPQQLSPSMIPQQLAPNINPQHLPTSLNPQQLAPNINPQQLSPSMNPQQLQSSMNPQQLSPSMIPQQLAPNINPQHLPSSMNPQQLQSSMNPQHLPSSMNPQQLAPNINPQHLPSSMNPQQLQSSMNPQHLPSSMNPHQLQSSMNPQQLSPSMNPQQLSPSMNPQQFSQFNPPPYIQQTSQTNPNYNPPSISQSYYQALPSQYPQSTPPPNHQASSSNQDTCSLCMQKFKGSEILAQTHCEHKFHKECIAPILSEIIDIGTYPIRCLAGNCKFNIELPVIKAALPASVSKRYEELSLRYVVSPTDRFEFGCPSCKAFTWVMKNVEQFKCNGCKKNYCGRCMRVDHFGYICP